MKLSKIAALVVVIAVALFIMLPSLSWAAEDGKALFTKCAACHGADAAGKPAMKAPAIKGADAAKIKTTVTTNAKHAGVKSLTDDQIKAIADYLKTVK
jgi:mono/diheme cytochrome c family protein